MTWNGFVALGTTSASVFTESTATGYARSAFSFGFSQNGRVQGYGLPLTFTASSAVVATYNALAFFTASSGGSPLLVYNLNAPFSYGVNVNFVLNPYSVILDLLDNMTGAGLPLDVTGANLITGQGGVPLRNIAATTDPGVSNDVTQGYDTGSVWINTTLSRVWMCQSNATGAATWLLDGVIPGVGVEPSSMMTQFGGGAGTFLEEGNVNRQISSAGVNPGSTANDNVLAVYSLPASSFDVANRGLTITASGSFAANGNTKRVKLIFNATTAVVGSAVTGGTTISDTGAVTTNAGGWSVQGSVFKYGAAASNTQLGIHNSAQCGSTVAALLAPSLITATESGAILIAVTGNATTTATDIVFNWFEVNAMN